VSRQPREPKGRSTGGEFAKKPSNDAKFSATTYVRNYQAILRQRG
jgi:hypothetical protein